MRGWEGKMGGWARAEQNPHPADPGPAHLAPFPFMCLAGTPQFPRWRGKGWGAGTIRAAGGRDIDHSSLHHGGLRSRPGQSSVPRGWKGAAGRDEIELVGGEREESRGALEPASCPFIQCRPVCGGGVKERPPSRCLMGLSEAQINRCFPQSQSPSSRAQLSPLTPQPGLFTALTCPG